MRFGRDGRGATVYVHTVAGLRKPEKGLKLVLIRWDVSLAAVAGLRKPEKGLKLVRGVECAKALWRAESQDSENPRRD